MGEGNWNESDLWQREAEENGLQMEPELQNAVQSPKQIRKNCRREVRRVCNVLGWALAFFSVMTVLVSILLEVAGNVWADGGVISTFLNRMRAHVSCRCQDRQRLRCSETHGRR